MDSLYWRQFMLSAGMVLLTMVLLGVSFYALSYNYTVAEKRSEMRDRANLISQLSVNYLLAGDDTENTQEDALRSLAGVASRMTDVGFLICNRKGDVLLTSDAGLVGKSVRVPEEIVETTFSNENGYEGRSTVGVYEQKKFVVGVPLTDESGNVLGLVLAVMDGTALMEMWRSFIGLFFMLSAIILLIAFVTSSVTSMQQIKPITEMVQATRAYADGNFDVRMQETSSGGAGHGIQRHGRFAAGDGAAAPRLHRQRVPRAENAYDYHRRLYRWHFGRHHPTGEGTAVFADHL